MLYMSIVCKTKKQLRMCGVNGSFTQPHTLYKHIGAEAL